jgi:hypothetical protein
MSKQFQKKEKMTKHTIEKIKEYLSWDEWDNLYIGKIYVNPNKAPWDRDNGLYLIMGDGEEQSLTSIIESTPGEIELTKDEIQKVEKDFLEILEKVKVHNKEVEHLNRIGVIKNVELVDLGSTGFTRNQDTSSVPCWVNKETEHIICKVSEAPKIWQNPCLSDHLKIAKSNKFKVQLATRLKQVWIEQNLDYLETLVEE